jgi:CDP-glucose 4,6-dehydratase
MSRAFGALRDRAVLVTGHTGFKGSWLALWLHRLGAHVHGYSLPAPTTPSHFVAADVESRLASHRTADVRDRAALRDAFSDVRPDVVFHLAAQPLVRRGHAEPFETFSINTLGTAAVLDAVREAGRPMAVVIVTSDKCYRNLDDGSPCREGDPLGGTEPYGASKAAAEIVVEAYRHSYFESGLVRLASARAGNVIGGGDWAPDRLIPDCIRALERGETVVVRNPDAVRPWQHILEPLAGYLTLAVRLLSDAGPQASRAWNFGPDQRGEATVREVVRGLFAAWGSGSWREHRDGSEPAEAPQLRLSIEHTRQELGWSPRWSLETALLRTAAWYRRHRESGGRALVDASLADIAEYESAA